MGYISRMNDIDIIYTALTSNKFNIGCAVDWNEKRYIFRKILMEVDRYTFVDANGRWRSDVEGNKLSNLVLLSDHKLLTINNFVTDLSKIETKVRPQLNNFYQNGGMMPRSVKEKLTEINALIDDLYQEIIQICLKL